MPCPFLIFSQSDYLATPTSNFQPIRLLDPVCWYEFTYLTTNSADPVHWIYTVCKCRAYPCLAGLMFRANTVSNNPERGEQRHWSDCLYVQGNLGFWLSANALHSFTWWGLYFFENLIKLLQIHSSNESPQHNIYLKIRHFELIFFLFLMKT